MCNQKNNMKHIISLLLIIVGTNILYGQNPVEIDCYKPHITTIKSIDPDNMEFSDLEFLKEILQNRQIVILGESGHGDGLTFEAKTRLIKFLIEELNFNTIAFEGGGFWEMYYASQNIQKGLDAKMELNNSWYGLWSKSQQTQSLLDYIQINNKNINLLGIENQSGNLYSPKLALILDSLVGQEAFYNINYEAFNKNTAYYSYSFFGNPSYREKVDILILKNDLEIIKQNLLKSNNQHASVMLQGIKNYEGLIKQMELNEGSYSDQNKSINLRDSLMAENIFWELNQHPNQKVIIWTANFHAAHNLDQAIYKKDDDFYQVFKPLGHRLKEKYGNKVYSIAFTSAQGETANLYEKEPHLISTEKDTWEFELSRLTQDKYSFVNFENIQSEMGCIDRTFNSSILGYKKHLGNWFNIFDGIFFIRNMKRSEIKK